MAGLTSLSMSGGVEAGDVVFRSSELLSAGDGSD